MQSERSQPVLSDLNVSLRIRLDIFQTKKNIFLISVDER